MDIERLYVQIRCHIRSIVLFGIEVEDWGDEGWVQVCREHKLAKKYLPIKKCDVPLWLILTELIHMATALSRDTDLLFRRPLNTVYLNPEAAIHLLIQGALTLETLKVAEERNGAIIFCDWFGSNNPWRFIIRERMPAISIADTYGAIVYTMIESLPLQ